MTPRCAGAWGPGADEKSNPSIRGTRLHRKWKTSTGSCSSVDRKNGMLRGSRRRAVSAAYHLVTMFWAPLVALYRVLRYRQRGGPPGGEQSFGIACISHVPWSGAWQRNHHAMHGLTKRHKVLYCHPVIVCGDRLDFIT